MNRYKVEFVTSRECDAVEGGGAWCVIEHKRTHDEVISQHATEQDAQINGWRLAKAHGERLAG